LLRVELAVGLAVLVVLEEELDLEVVVQAGTDTFQKYLTHLPITP
jgi:hypothetical protein